MSEIEAGRKKVSLIEPLAVQPIALPRSAAESVL